MTTSGTAVIASISAVISALALILNGYNYYENFTFQSNAKQIDAAISWCKEFHMTSFIDLQASVRALSFPPYVVQPIKENEQKRMSADDVDKLISEAGISKNDLIVEEKSIVGLLNYLETGAQFVEQGSLDKSRFVTCFKEYKEPYFKRYDESLVGLRLQADSKKTAREQWDTFDRVTQ